MDTNRYEAELSSRLDTVEDPAYEDPARTDLPRSELALVAVGVVLVVVVMWLWGYPA